MQGSDELCMCIWPTCTCWAGKGPCLVNIVGPGEMPTLAGRQDGMGVQVAGSCGTFLAVGWHHKSGHSARRSIGRNAEKEAEDSEGPAGAGREWETGL